MRTRFSWVSIVGFLATIVVITLLPRSTALPGPPLPTPSSTPAASATVPFVAYATRPARTATSLPLQPTHTSAATWTFAAVPSETLAAAGTATLLSFPTAQPTPASGSATPPVPIAVSKDGKAVACTKGPGVEYIVKTNFKAAQIVGKDPSAAWWYLAVYKGNNVFINCWVSAQQVDVSGNLSGVLVNEPEAAQITRIQIVPPAGTLTAAVFTVACGSGAQAPVLHFTGQIFADGPIMNVGYTWGIDNTRMAFPHEQTRIQGWNTPAAVTLDLPLPAEAHSYDLSLRSLYPMEASADFQFEVKCR